MWKRREPEIELKTADQLVAMRAAGLVVADALRAAADAARPGVSTADLDAVASDIIQAAGAVPSFRGYHGYPATICTSVNAEIVHGIPSPDQKLRDGDVLSLDCGAIVDGWHADAALTVGIGLLPAGLAQLIAACEQAMWCGLAAVQVGGRLTDISHAVEQSARAAGPYGLVEDYVGHGIGSHMHMDPPVPNQGRPGRGPLLQAGMALAIEPLLTMGSPESVLLDDGWTAATADGGIAAHFEHTVALTAGGPWVLTEPDGGRAGLRRAGPATGLEPLNCPAVGT
jgi:methionyl aminopeptidase